MKEIRIGLYGNNGHQLQKDHVLPLQNARVAASCGIPKEELSTLPDIRYYENYAALLADKEIDLISLCAPVRAEQAELAIAALRAGKHVYADKPGVMSVSELERVLSVAKECGFQFFEMAGTSYDEPYLTAKSLVQSGVLGQIVQVSVQKSYPLGDWRPQDESVDGGLMLQVGIHAARLIEHTAGQRIIAVSGSETGLGNPKPGQLKTASAFTFKLSGGGLASAVVNYLNHPIVGSWGNENLRVFGMNGFLETEPVAKTVHLVTKEKNEWLPSGDWANYLQAVVDFLLGLRARPFTVEEEFHPLRVVIAAKESAKHGGIFIEV